MLLSKLLFISIISFLISATAFTHSYSQCLEDQRGLLLQLKKELIFNSSLSTKLVQWNQTHDCCKWYGVDCDDAGYVISLQLDHESISDGIGDSSSLFRLQYLEKLNLAFNDLESTLIPKGIHNLSYLTHLNLSNAGFGGQVPLQLSFLRRLVSLDISNYDYMLMGPLKLEYPNLEMLIQNLTGLRELFLDGVNIISPYGNNHSTTKFLDFFANLSSLTTLSLVGCGLKGSFPNKIFHIPTLQNIDLSENELLSGSLPPFSLNGSLKSIVLRGTNFSGSIPSSISNLKNLSEIYLSFSQFTGSIPSTFANLTQLIRVDLSSNFLTGSLYSELFEGLSSLVYLSLDYNSFSGKIPHSLFGLPSMKTLYLRNCKFIRLIEEFSTVNVSNIVTLDLRGNRLEGPIHDSLFQLQSLEVLILSENLFSGTFQLPKIQSLANLRYLDLSRNNLRVDVTNHNSTSYGFPQLQVLLLASCNLHVIPDFIKHSDISILDLSINGIGGEIPSWIWGLTQLNTLNLSHNLLTSLQKPYHIPSSLNFLDLSSNQLSGELNFPIPPNITSHLWYLSLSNNSLSGSLESINFSSWRGMVQGIDSQLRHKDSGYFNLYSSGKIWLDFSTVDLSCNNFEGEIPNAIGDLSSLHLLNFSHNALNGSIPKSFGKLGNLESLDLSRNYLTGAIPMELVGLSFLSLLNLSYNMLVGEIPIVGQFQTFSADSFKGNPWLCGFPLDINCGSHTVDDESDLSHEKVEIEWEYVFAALGYVVGLGSFAWLLLLCRSFRKKYFDKIDEVVQQIFDARDMRRRRRATARRRAVKNRDRRQ